MRLKRISGILLAIIIILSIPIPVFSESFHYIHDPMANPNAAKDIVVNPDAVYGYSPSPESERLKDYVDYDWTNPTVVAEMQEQREAYHESFQELYDMIDTMKAEGDSIEDIARAVSTRRNELRIEAYDGDPKGLAELKQSNLDTYGNENGGTPDYFYEKYGSWEVVLEKALSANPGADACLGLYDKYYDTYMIENQTYMVQSGDSLMGIADKLLGDKELWEVIYELNKDTISDPNLIFPGQILQIEK